MSISPMRTSSRDRPLSTLKLNHGQFPSPTAFHSAFVTLPRIPKSNSTISTLDCVVRSSVEITSVSERESTSPARTLGSVSAGIVDGDLFLSSDCGGARLERIWLRAIVTSGEVVGGESARTRARRAARASRRTEGLRSTDQYLTTRLAVRRSRHWTYKELDDPILDRRG